MKILQKQIITISVLLIAAIVIISTVLKLTFFSFDNTSFQNADIIITYFDKNGEEQRTKISNTGEIKTLSKICSCKISGEIFGETPACFFDTVQISFINEKKQTNVYPSPDGCNNLLIEKSNGANHYHSLSKTEMKNLIKILEKNNIEWNW